jgi:hypothetical protein|tara:strand:+ start:76 stop:360 length:285 start_codon:yes stop_codon:yes gene_type:complete
MKTKEQKIIKFIKRHFEDTSAIGYEPYTLDKEYPLQEQVVDEVINCMGDDYHEEGWEKDGKNAFDDYDLINEILSQHFSEDLKNLKVMLRLQLQ